MTELDLDELIAHQPPMRLLDRVLSVGENEAAAELTVRRDNPLFVPGRGLPAYSGLELMAQTIALIDGWRCRNEGTPPKIGFLLGCRRYATECTAFDDGMTLVISVKMVLAGVDMYSFDSKICDTEGRVLATANLNVYAPKNPEAYLKDGTV